jgi:putative acetyltransferase
MNFPIHIRVEQPADLAAVREVLRRAFGRDGEADLVDRIRANCTGTLSLVAESSERVIMGHALCSPVTIEADTGKVIGAGLGPVAVLPEFQKRGVGSALIRAALAKLEKRQTPFVVVLGHPTYYPRFGFVPASSVCGIRSNWNVPDEVFMIRVFEPTTLRGVRGVARYRGEFEGV